MAIFKRITWIIILLAIFMALREGVLYLSANPITFFQEEL